MRANQSNQRPLHFYSRTGGRIPRTSKISRVINIICYFIGLASAAQMKSCNRYSHIHTTAIFWLHVTFAAHATHCSLRGRHARHTTKLCSVAYPTLLRRPVSACLFSPIAASQNSTPWHSCTLLLEGMITKTRPTLSITYRIDTIDPDLLTLRSRDGGMSGGVCCGVGSGGGGGRGVGQRAYTQEARQQRQQGGELTGSHAPPQPHGRSHHPCNNKHSLATDDTRIWSMDLNAVKCIWPIDIAIDIAIHIAR